MSGRRNLLLTLPHNLRQMVTAGLNLKDFVCGWRNVHRTCVMHKQATLNTSFADQGWNIDISRLTEIFDRIEMLEPHRKFTDALPLFMHDLLRHKAAKALSAVLVSGEESALEDLLLILARREIQVTRLHLSAEEAVEYETWRVKPQRFHARIIQYLLSISPNLEEFSITADCSRPVFSFLRLAMTDCFASMTQLKWLELDNEYCWPVDAHSLHVIGTSCTKLKTLLIRSSPITNESIAGLAPLKNTLEWLDLFGCPLISNDVANAIGHLSSLHVLQVMKTQVKGNPFRSQGLERLCNTCDAEACCHGFGRRN